MLETQSLCASGQAIIAMLSSDEIALGRLCVAIAVFIVAFVGAFVAWRNMVATTRMKKKEYFDKLFEEFRNDIYLAKRREVLNAFKPHITCPESLFTTRWFFFSCDLLGPAMKKREGMFDRLRAIGFDWPSLDEFKHTLGDPAMVGEVEAKWKAFEVTLNDVLDTMEHLGTLVRIKALSNKDIRLVFYTSMCDTFLCTLPYIEERRKNKPDYARGCQSLAADNPATSFC